MNKASRVQAIYWGDILIGIHSYLPLMGGTVRDASRGHRIVILPDYQGLGMGTRIIDFFGELFIQSGRKYFLKTTHARFGGHMDSKIEWKATAENKRVRGEKRTAYDSNRDNGYNASYINKENRIAYSYEYVGKNYMTRKHQLIVCHGDIEYSIACKLLDTIIDKNKFTVLSCGVASVDNVTVWEKIAKERGIRNIVLQIKSKGVLRLNKSSLSTSFDAILTTIDSREIIADYKRDINKCICCYDTDVSKHYIFDKKLKCKTPIV